MKNDKKTLFFDDYKYLDPLIDVGFRHDEAKIYEFLLKNHEQKASEIAKNTGISRVLAYRALENLENKGVIEKYEEKGSVTTFTAKHPSELSIILEKQKRQTLKAEAELSQFLGAMSSDFNLATGKPNVRFFEGISGLKKLYEMINQEKNDILLIRSPFDDDFPEIHTLVLDQVTKQAQKGIHTRAITPFQESTKKTFLESDAKNLVERRIIEPNTLNLPSQIIIFGNSVGITSFGNILVTTIISDELVAKTMTSLFEYTWTASETTHKQYIEKIISS